jgi:phage-related protein
MMPGFSWRRYSVGRCRMISNRCRRSDGGVEEIRIRDESGTYRVIYTARLESAVFVLHAFQKKTQATAKGDIKLARARFEELIRESK